MAAIATLGSTTRCTGPACRAGTSHETTVWRHAPEGVVAGVVIWGGLAPGSLQSVAAALRSIETVRKGGSQKLNILCVGMYCCPIAAAALGGAYRRLRFTCK